jgi:hypothetical protein
MFSVRGPTFQIPWTLPPAFYEYSGGRKRPPTSARLGGFFHERLVGQPGRGQQLIRRPKLGSSICTKNSDYTALAGRILIAVLFLMSATKRFANGERR